MSTPTDAVTVRMDTVRQKLRLLAGMLVLLAIVAAFVYAATQAHGVKRTGPIVVAVLVALVAVAIGWGGLLAVRPQALVVDATGLRRESSRTPWRVEWSELQRLTVQKGSHRDARWPHLRSWHIRVVLSPAHPDFEVRHPELHNYRGRFGAAAGDYGVVLGPAPELVAPLDAALRGQPAAPYAGVVEVDARGLG